MFANGAPFALAWACPKGVLFEGRPVIREAKPLE
jgi:hypothetical protein